METMFRREDARAVPSRMLHMPMAMMSGMRYGATKGMRMKALPAQKDLSRHRHRREERPQASSG